ncbi:Rieske 2Fe-2S domain-containing protein, partial [Mycobacterium sp. E796]|uniref:Rieske 2Fe-2S domain-containing protein n=1 Tax=Mycobacterium sp. E796 TaxID=1834151 RepID=UPI000AC96CF2
SGRLFTRVWQPACREEEVPDAGCFYEYTIGRQSIAVVRQKDGSVKAFHNTCAHPCGAGSACSVT